MFSDRVRYILNLMIHLTLLETEEYLTVKEIAGELAVPEAYLGKIVGELAELGYVETKKGPSGGIKLRGSPDDISVKELLHDLQALEHNTMNEACCVPDYADQCILDHWISAFEDRVLENSTLSDVTRTVASSPPSES